MDKPKIATACFASCTGCHMALAEPEVGFVDLLPSIELVFSPVLMDSKQIHDADLVMVEGSIRNEEDLRLLREARAAAKTLIALGTCACFGGVPGLANMTTVEQLTTGVYDRDSLGDGVPALNPRLLPVDSYVEVDYYIPGCPPPVAHLANILKALLAGDKPPRIDTPVCSECRRTAGPEPLADLARPFTREPLLDKCLLVQGLPCLGSVTRGGCGAACTHANVPCSGCRGPTDHILLESRHGVYRDIVYRISHLLEMPVKEVEKKLSDIPHILYAYSLASPSLRRKDAERVSRWVYRIQTRSRS
jgi:F420-non-reducing hydrogenase small subunit